MHLNKNLNVTWKCKCFKKFKYFRTTWGGLGRLNFLKTYDNVTPAKFNAEDYTFNARYKWCALILYC